MSLVGDTLPHLRAMARRWTHVGGARPERVRGLRVGRPNPRRPVEPCPACQGVAGASPAWWAFWLDELCRACAGTGTATDVDNVAALRFWRAMG